MNRFDDVLALAKIRGLVAKLVPVDPVRLEQLVKLNPGLPEDYIEFLREIGSGSFGDGAYSVYDGLVSPDEIFDPDSAGMLGDLLIFGDDFQGFNGAYQPQNGWTVVEIDSATMTHTFVADSFEKFFRQKVGGLLA